MTVNNSTIGSIYYTFKIYRMTMPLKYIFENSGENLMVYATAKLSYSAFNSKNKAVRDIFSVLLIITYFITL